MNNQKMDGKDIPVIAYEQIEKIPFIKHGISTRMGGVSKGIYSTMNLSFQRGDEEEAVRENFLRFTEVLGISAENLVFSAQTHQTNVRRVTKEDRGKGFFRPVDYTDVDGLITNEPEVCLVTFYADCVPLLFVDPVKKAIGLSHSGWRGTVGKMGAKTLKEMEKAYGTNPGDVIAAIGPSICAACYEVSEDVAEEFRSRFSEDDCKSIVFPKEKGKFQLDLWEANRKILLHAGVKEEHLSMPPACTCCNPAKFFSHRASQGKRGNLAAFLQISS